MFSQKTLVGIIASLVTAMAIGSFTWVWTVNVQVKILQLELQQIKENKAAEKLQDAHIRSLWRYGAFLHEQVDALRFKEGLPPATKPRLED